MPKKRPKLTDSDWSRVFTLRCKSKQGQALREDELRLCETAFAEDRERYSALTEPVFNTTKPFGST